MSEEIGEKAAPDAVGPASDADRDEWLLNLGASVALDDFADRLRARLRDAMAGRHPHDPPNAAAAARIAELRALLALLAEAATVRRPVRRRAEPWAEAEDDDLMAELEEAARRRDWSTVEELAVEWDRRHPATA